MTAKWTPFPHTDVSYATDAAQLKKQWARLHRGDCEPWPKDPDTQRAWHAFHAGEFAKAVDIGTRAGDAALNAAIKAQAIYAHYLAPEKSRLALFEQAAQWAEERRSAAPKDANAQYLHAMTLGRYGQKLSVAKALAQGMGSKIKDALVRTIELEPKHAEAHTAFGAYQAEVIDKVGALVAGITYGAKRDSALEHFEAAIRLFPESAIARIEYANGLLLLFGKARIADAEKLYGEASKCKPADAMERLDVELARSEIA
jgi:tetratricopeptide (TPR) repeat protein